MKKYYCYFYGGVGKLGIGVLDGSLTDLHFEKSNMQYGKFEVAETHLHKEVNKQLLEFFDGRRRNFDLPLAPEGTDFQLRCWNELLKVPYGETRSYGDIALSIGCPRGFRAVGMANNRNPIAIVIPCHRIIGKNGALVGFGGGLEVKKFLLNLERNHAIS